MMGHIISYMVGLNIMLHKDELALEMERWSWATAKLMEKWMDGSILVKTLLNKFFITDAEFLFQIDSNKVQR